MSESPAAVAADLESMSPQQIEARARLRLAAKECVELSERCIQDDADLTSARGEVESIQRLWTHPLRLLPAQEQAGIVRNLTPKEIASRLMLAQENLRQVEDRAISDVKAHVAAERSYQRAAALCRKLAVPVPGEAPVAVAKEESAS